MILSKLLNIKQYSLNRKNKNKFFVERLNYLNNFHYNNCKEYKKILDFENFNNKKFKTLDKMPYLFTKLFKLHKFLSKSKSKIQNILSSSGTTHSSLSKIYLDKSTSAEQSRVLTKIVFFFIKKRLPMLIIDSKDFLNQGTILNARKIGILGFSLVGKNITFALNAQNEINYENISKFLKKYQDQDFIIFGLTYVVWDFFLNKLDKSIIKYSFDNAIIIHGGGWKKMLNKSVNNITFKKYLYTKFNIKNIHNYYGMVEQPGSIFMECSQCNRLVCSNFSDILIRGKNFEVLPHNQRGIIQVTSLLPKSYPGHNLLTEDIGIILGEDNCHCGIKGKYFEVEGRIPNAEVRGCSDAYFN